MSPRTFRHLAANNDKDTSKVTADLAPKAPAKPEAAKAAPPSAGDGHISIAQQRRNDWEIVKKLSGNLWPKDDWATRSRVLVGLGLLVAGKVSIVVISVHSVLTSVPGLKRTSPLVVQEHH